MKRWRGSKCTATVDIARESWKPGGGLRCWRRRAAAGGASLHRGCAETGSRCFPRPAGRARPGRVRLLEGLDGRARANIEKFLDMIRDYAAATPGTLSQLIERLDAQREEQPEPEARRTEAANAVSVMTIHAAKGLQFPIASQRPCTRRPTSKRPRSSYRAESGLAHAGAILRTANRCR
jgi:hypothetical protein